MAVRVGNADPSPEPWWRRGDEVPGEAMKKSRSHWIISSIVLLIVIGGLCWVDERVAQQVNALISGGNPLHHRIADVGDALLTAAKHQSIENAPVVVFTALGFILFLFMVKT
jgi:hypothetical protein